MKMALMAVLTASLLSACAPRHPVVGDESCAVWRDANGSLSGRAVAGEYAAGFIDAYSESHETREIQYSWMIDSISAECERDPSLKIYQAAEKAAKRFEK
jgi:hypothetical protein